MPFSSLLFLSVFLPAFLVAYGVSPRALKNAVALAFSLVFYAWGAPRLLPVVVGLGVLDYYLGHAVARNRTRVEAAAADGDPATQARFARRGRLLLAFGITIHFSILAYFKYSNFLVAQANDLLALMPSQAHIARIAWTEVPLPIGISFLTFEEISYLVDVHRGHAKPARSVGRYLLFLMLFPHSIAGPIFRWKDLEAQLDARDHGLAHVLEGVGRFVMGLSKKVLVADAAAIAVDPIFAAPGGSITTKMAWLGAFAYTIQIYFDFSGYSDMAIGLGKMAGFRFKENFDAPYRSASVTEFWKRWHISLSTWLRDYLYVPLGGNRHGERRTRLHVLVVFALSGLWHGAAWTFVLWGIYHGALVVAERTEVVKRVKGTLPRAANVAVTLGLVLIGWVLFRAQSMKSVSAMLGAMFGVRAADVDLTLTWAQVLPRRSAVLLAGALFVTAILPLFISEERGRSAFARLRTVGLALAPIALLLVIAQLVNSGFQPLIYFKF
jgi:alginate O-acetyltransferase complex protein AlgI